MIGGICMNQTTDRQVAVFLAEGFETIEALTVADLLTRAGIPHTLVSITDDTRVTSSHGVEVVADGVIKDLDFSQYDMLVLPGGIPGTPNLEACPLLMQQVKAFAAGEKAVAAICASPSILAHLGLLRGVRAACNPCVEKDLMDGGAVLVHEPAVLCENLITSRGMGTATPFGLAIVRYFLGEETAEKLRRKILYQDINSGDLHR